MTTASSGTPKESNGPVDTAAAGVTWALRHAPSHARLWVAAVVGLTADLWSKSWAFSAVGWDESKPIIGGFLSFELSVNPGALFGLGAGFAPVFIGASVLALMFVLYLFANSASSQRSLHVALGLVLAGAVGNLYDRATQEACVAILRGTTTANASAPRKASVRGTLVEEDSRSISIAKWGTRDVGVQTFTLESAATPADRWVVREYGPQPVVRDFIKVEIEIGGRPIYPWIFNIADALLVAGVGLLLLNFWTERRRHGAAPAG